MYRFWNLLKLRCTPELTKQENDMYPTYDMHPLAIAQMEAERFEKKKITANRPKLFGSKPFDIRAFGAAAAVLVAIVVFN
jgi:hypothetical protein